MMNKNLIWAMALSIGFYLIWFNFVDLPKQREAQAKQKAQLTLSEGESKEPQIKAPPTEPDIPKAKIISKITAPTDVKKIKKQMRTVPFELPGGTLQFSTQGAAIVSYSYNSPVEKIELIPNPSPGFFATFDDTFFDVSEQTANSITFAAELADDVLFTKKYEWDFEKGLGTLTMAINNNANGTVEVPGWRMSLGPAIGTAKNQISDNEREMKSVYYKTDSKVTEIKQETLNAGPWDWAALENRYFIAAVIPSDWKDYKISYKREKVNSVKSPFMAFEMETSQIAPKTTKTWESKFYFGAKNYRELKAQGLGLEKSVDFGFFSTFGRWAMQVLYFNYSFTGNYGWAIIILTIIVQIILFPLTYKSQKSTMLMKKVQPKLKALQKKYPNKEDAAKMQAEMMALYKEHGVNPFGGCLPMLLQLPIFFALFTALRNSWDLHGAAWIFWIKDLSSKDPYFILPILMGALMFFQQKITMGEGADAMQMNMIKWMPVIFTVMFATFPSGLVLYWITSSFISFIVQFVMNKKLNKAA